LHDAAHWFNFEVMRFFSRTIFLASVLTVIVTLAGCSPMGDTTSDDQKEPHFVLGKNRVNAMDYSGAVEAFQEALEVNPHSAAAHFQLACLYDSSDTNLTKISDPAAAIYHFQQFLQFDPNAENADIIRDRIYGCKRLLAENISSLPSSSAAQQQVEKLAEQNRQLQSQIDHLNDVIKQWNAYYASQLAKTNLAAQNNIGTIPGQTPDDISTQPTNPAPLPTPRITKRTHIVEPHETLASIARRFGVSVNAMEIANPRVNPKKLKVGQILNLPSP